MEISTFSKHNINQKPASQYSVNLEASLYALSEWPKMLHKKLQQNLKIVFRQALLDN